MATRRHLLGILGGAVVLLGCPCVAYLAVAAIDLAAPGTVITGRGLGPTPVAAAIAVFAGGLWWTLGRGHRWPEMLGSLVVVEGILLGLIQFFSGATALDAFTLDWWLGVNVYLAPPWLAAALAGAVRPR